MSDWMFWMIAAGVMVILEMLSGTFYLLMIGTGMAAGGIAALAGAGIELQFMVAAVVGIAATYLLRRRHRRVKGLRGAAERDPNVNLDIGQSVVIDEWKSIDGSYTARVMYRGANWDVELAQGNAAEPGVFVIQEVRGSRLIVGHGGAKNY